MERQVALNEGDVARIANLLRQSASFGRRALSAAQVDALCAEADALDLTAGCPAAGRHERDPVQGIEALGERIATLEAALGWAMGHVPEPKTQRNIYATHYADAAAALDDHETPAAGQERER